ncbi:hypothetical protein MA6G0728R_0821 [Mycobacteroides abscessus 6G-0728-R]|uniref:Uncharacterized protein n=1 Tax=Mycobacteroides abscessus 1948 TaxID=1299323 RepID=A0A829QR19_9MYCO|nr:hypothetical protein MA6G0125R_5090 [Mycobacteroides abscessus 6G-0125-R]EIU50585.1 hypothetical protein MA6G0125S_0828 [Mycobacteroides abscessus 6G-0125-S]EIU56134.1 hypothetical protein MA6G0728S_1158 [Mycobacteroides abscessus 6G-0728-S]EIU66439.1 hypothetical protein MA6G1108_0818 [Mycobacteroides abscessus 6G-1108]EIU98736.1 hypothetical protein MA6G0212_0889 [Mycobacteroides abscessus 6G-0212]EIV02819.1 hypothetical protein MA6G0728R_0821 [Mycobacteroides abscessus 6G-0728-R]EIV2935
MGKRGGFGISQSVGDLLDREPISQEFLANVSRTSSKSAR